ncbi:g7340 [Coccomyxa elongata]
MLAVSSQASGKSTSGTGITAINDALAGSEQPFPGFPMAPATNDTARPSSLPATPTRLITTPAHPHDDAMQDGSTASDSTAAPSRTTTATVSLVVQNWVLPTTYTPVRYTCD